LEGKSQAAILTFYRSLCNAKEGEVFAIVKSNKVISFEVKIGQRGNATKEAFESPNIIFETDK